MTRIIIDTDPGIDDILALLLAFASPELQIEAITTVNGNVSVDLTTHNALAFLEMLGRSDVPVARGCTRPLVNATVNAGDFHGASGVGDIIWSMPQQKPVAQSAAGLIIEKVLASPGEITLVAIGPLTNLALALHLEPGLAQAVREVVIMGGALRVPGNVTPAAEFNIFADPHAAQTVLHAGWPVRMVSLDVTTKVCLRYEHFRYLQQTGNPLASFLEKMVDYTMRRFPGPREQAGFELHDPLCLATLVRPDFVTWEDVYVAVELQGTHTTGQTVGYFPDHGTPAPRAPNVRASVGVDSAGFLEWFTERLYTYLK